MCPSLLCLIVWKTIDQLDQKQFSG
uniref:Uncharacterized protein n=1 Tax=Tetranychus urticae TaxID=32264 RepID=T1K716_TETUR